jgi:AraC-like DNA-binding protein
MHWAQAALLHGTFRRCLVILGQSLVRTSRQRRNRMAINRDSRTREVDTALCNSKPRRLGGLPTATGSIARSAYARAREAGIDLGPLLKKAGLTHGEIEAPKRRLTVRSQITFLNLTAGALDDDLLGFHLAQSPDLREIGLVFYVMASSETLHEALQKAARYCSIVNDGISLRYTEGTDVSVALSYVGVSRYQDRHQIEFWMTTIVRIVRQLTGHRVAPTSVRLIHHRSEDQTELGKFFGSDVKFGASVDELAFSLSIKHMPVVDADPYLNKLLTAYCEETLSHQSRTRNSLRSSIENAIVPLLPHGKVQIDEVARILGVSQRTLARRLASEGGTFSEVLENLRSNLANHYLLDDGLSISQIAWLLGYREVSSFSHAFKRWTGGTPREVRSRMAPPLQTSW